MWVLLMLMLPPSGPIRPVLRQQHAGATKLVSSSNYILATSSSVRDAGQASGEKQCKRELNGMFRSELFTNTVPFGNL